MFSASLNKTFISFIQSAVTDGDDPMFLFTSILNGTAEKTSAVPNVSDTCKDTIKDVSKMNSQTSVKSVWNRFRTINEK